MSIRAGSGKGSGDAGGTSGGGGMGSFGGSGGSRKRRNKTPFSGGQPQKKPLQPVADSPFPEKRDFRLGQYRVLEERDDYLLCTGYDPNAKNPFAEVTPSAFRTGVLMKVAKPPALQRTPWDGQTVTIGGTDYTYDYSDAEFGVRDSNGDEERIDPPYIIDGVEGDIIVAVQIKKNAAVDGMEVTDEDGSRLRWIDLNVSGRHWKSTSGGSIDISGLLLGGWTLSEHDPTTGDTIKTWYRGPSRETTLAHDHDVLFVLDGKLLTAGETNIGKNNGIGVLYDDATGAVDWYSDHSGIASPITSLSTGALPSYAKGLLESADGFLWLSGTLGVGRLNPSTGAFTHRYGGAASAIWQSPAADGTVLVAPGASSVLVALVDNTGTELANFGSTPGRVDISGNVVAATLFSGITNNVVTRSATDLTLISTHTDVGWTSIGDCATDGTNVYVITGEVRLRARLASNVATDVWNVAPGGMATASSSVVVNPINGHVYTINGSTVWNVRKHNSANGATMWTSSNYFASLATNSSLGAHTRIGFGSDFVVFASPAAAGGTLGAAASYNVVCLNDSDGSLRWKDWVGDQIDNVSAFGANLSFAGGVHVTSDDRIFVSHGRKQQ